MLGLRGSNFSQLVHEDVFILWCLKSNVMINWPHHIMQHMIKYCDNDMPLPYGCLITHLMLLYDMNLMRESSITLGWNNLFGKKTMKKMNIFEINGV